MSYLGTVEADAVALAETYFSGRLHTEAWDDLEDTEAADEIPEVPADPEHVPPIVGSPAVPAVEFAYNPQKFKALTHATRILERLNYKGAKTDTLQSYQFPRSPDTEIPQDMQDACCELALSLLDGVDPDLEFENLRLTQQSMASAKSTYDRSTVVEHIAAGVPSISAWRLLKPYLEDTNSVNLVRV
jgi:hypothetical protein